MDTVFEVEQRVLGEDPYLLEDQSLAQLRKYKYSSVDRSLLSYYVLNPFWTWCAGFMPPWLAPNCITLIGISSILVCNFLVLVLQGGDMMTPMPRVVYLLIGVSFLFYQTMDNIDGKQARKTGTSSPLGELFDHGIDSLNCLWGALLMVTTLSQGSSWPAVVSVIFPMVGMYFSTWETYYTQTLFLDWVNAPTEGLIVASGYHFLAGIFGPQIWTDHHIVGTNMPLGMLWTIPLALSVIFLHAPSCVRNVYSKDPTQFWSAVCMLWPMVLQVAAILVWVAGPTSQILSGGHLFMFGWALSFTFGRVSTTVILSHLCHQPYPRINAPVVVLIIGSVFYGLFPMLGLHASILSEIAYLRFYLVFSALYFFAFSHLVISKITSYLGIRAFTIENY